MSRVRSKSGGSSSGSSVASLTPTAVKTAAYTAAAGDYVPVDTTSGAVTVTLPTAPADKAQVGVKHVVRGGTNTVSIACGGSDVLNKTGGATTGTLTLLNQSAVLQYKASSGIWYVVGGDLPLSQVLAGPNAWTGTQDFTGATVSGLPGAAGVVAGLDGTGATDMKALIQAAIDGASAGSTVRLPGGSAEYKLTTGLTMRSDVTLDGQGAILNVTDQGATVHAITFSGVSRSRVTNIRFKGNATNKQSAIVFTAGAADCSVDHCNFDTNFQIVAIGGDAGVACVACGVSDCILEGSTSEGIEFVDSTGCYAERNHVKQSGSSGVVFYTRTAGMNVGCRAVDNLLESCLLGVNVGGGSRTHIRGNTIRNSVGRGIIIQSGLNTSLTSVDGVCVGNTVDNSNTGDASANGIETTANTESWTISNNVSTNTQATGGTGGHGLALFGVAHTVQGNVSMFNANNGLDQSGDRFSIVGNVFNSNSQRAIGSRHGCNIQGNSNTLVGNVAQDLRSTPRQATGYVIASSTYADNVLIGNKGSYGTTGLTINDAGTRTVKIGNEDGSGAAQTETTLYGAFSHKGSSGTNTVGFYGATPVAKAASPGTAAGSDATVINAIVTALRNLGLVT